ncbi:MAG: hypothetical protein JSV17_14050 [Candidatus Aminicenantes bacterium]|nr:MAG: hypothetical protein JSV17_14050 [Candidatus Aminicenantes bacterium]
MKEKMMNEFRTADLEPALEWLRQQGHRLIFSPSSCWYDAAPGAFQAFPYHKTITPTEKELRQIFREGRVVALRYSAPIAASCGKISYHVVCSDSHYGLDQVSRQTRQNIRKGINYAAIEPITFSRLAREGWALRAETLARQGRLTSENEAWWKKLCLSAERLPGFEAWGALHKGILVASLIVYLAGDCYLMLYQQSLTSHLKFGINNALGFVFTQKALAKPGIRRLFYGFQSLDAPDKVDEFKFRMGYKAVPVRQRVLFHPALNPVVRPVTLATLKYIGGKILRSPKWLKVAGMMHFCLEGSRPLSQQDWPECLLEKRREWFGSQHERGLVLPGTLASAQYKITKDMKK